MVQKFYAVKSESVIAKAAIVTFVFALVIGTAAYLNGGLVHVFAAAPPIATVTVFEVAFPEIAVTVAVPDWLPALSFAIAWPSLVKAGDGVIVPSVVVKVTAVPFCTGLPLLSWTIATTSVVPLTGRVGVVV